MSNYNSIDQQNLNAQLETFKSFYPDLTHVQALTLDDVYAATKGQPVDWNAITPVDLAPSAALVDVPPCARAIGYVIFDVICLAVGALGLRSTLNTATVDAMARAAASARILPQIETIIAQMAAPNATTVDLAWGVWRILSLIKNGLALKAVFAAFKQNLTWWNALIYGVTGIATITAAFATGGLALIAEVVILLASFPFLVSDVAFAVNTCRLTPMLPPPEPTPVPGPMPYLPSVSIQTIRGNFITVVNNGGLGGPNDATSIIHTDARQVGPWEKFTLVPLDMTNNKFALKTMTGNYVTAVNGGGLGGPNNATSIIHTDAKVLGPWESLILIQQTDGTYAICTTSGYFLTAVNGGGLGGPNNATSIIHTDAKVLGPWEIFTFNSL